MSTSLRAITADEALDILRKHLLGEDWYVVDPIRTTQVNAIIVDDIIGMYKGATESPVNKWRRKHKRCEFCKYYKPTGPFDGVCLAKNKRVSFPSESKRFCRVFLLKPYKEEIE